MAFRGPFQLQGFYGSKWLNDACREGPWGKLSREEVKKGSAPDGGAYGPALLELREHWGTAVGPAEFTLV